MSLIYRRRQFGTTIFASVLVAASAVVVAWLFYGMNLGSRGTILLGLVLMLLVGTGWYFSSMTVGVTEDELRWRFWSRRFFRIARSDIEGVRIVRHWRLAGYGIRWHGPKCWTYIVTGRDAVEVRLKSGGWRRLGSDDQRRLIAVLAS